MEIVVFALMVVTAVMSILAVVFSMKAAKKHTQDGKNESVEGKIDSLLNVLSQEFSNNRRETSAALSEINNKLSENTERNLEYQRKVTVNINESLNGMRESIIKQNNDMTATIKTSTEKMAGDVSSSIEKMTSAVSESIEKIRAGNEKKLEEMRATVDEKLTSTLTTRLDSSFKTVSGQLEKLYTSLGEMKELSGGITQNVTNLNRILTNVKTRGSWAEYQLENILDQIIPGMYVKNYHPSGVSEVVEFAVKIPSSDGGGVSYLPIDSKFPMEDYVKVCAASDSGNLEELAQAKKALERRVLEEAKAVNKYISAPDTTPFAIMYLATEGLYAEIVSSKTGVLEKIQTDYSVMVAGPTTITALLNSFAMGFKTLAVNEKANEIKILLGNIKSQYDKFDALLLKIKKKLGEADQTVDEAAKRSGLMLKKLKDIDAVSASDDDPALME